MVQQQSTTGCLSSSKKKKAIIASSKKCLKQTSNKRCVSKKCKNTKKINCVDRPTVKTTVGDLICAIYDSAEGITQNQQLMGELIQHILTDVIENKCKKGC